MWQLIGMILAFGSLLTAVIVLAYKTGSKNAKLEAVLAEARERQNANKSIDNVRNMADADVRSRLQDTNDN